jgi:hypothetical protein
VSQIDTLQAAIEQLGRDAADIRVLMTQQAADREAQNVAHNAAIAAQNREIRKRTITLRWAVGVGLFAAAAFSVCIVLLALGMAENRRAIEENNRAWCPILGGVVAVSPPDAPMVDLFEGMFRDFRCSPSNIPTLPRTP